jgi:hypothetical protein
MLTLSPASAASLHRSLGKNCAWGKTSASACINTALAQTTQRATLVMSQLQINHNFSPYLPANPNVERLYPIHVVVFFERN